MTANLLDLVEAMKHWQALIPFYKQLRDENTETLCRLEYQRLKRWHFFEDELNHPTSDAE